MDLARDLLCLAKACALRTAGSMLDGIVHNLNNPTHALAMQVALLVNSLKKNPTNIDVFALQEKIERLRRVDKNFQDQIDALSWRQAYTRTSVELLDPMHFGTWLFQFWRNHCFFKHSVTMDIAADPPPPHVLVVPLALLWCLEEPLFSMADMFGDQDSMEFGMRFEVQGIATGGVVFKISASPVSNSLDVPLPSLEHEQSIHRLTQALGWDWRYFGEKNMISWRLTVPGQPSQPHRPKQIAGETAGEGS